MDDRTPWLDWAVELPPLSEGKNTFEQIKMCFEAKDAPHWTTRFD